MNRRDILKTLIGAGVGIESVESIKQLDAKPDDIIVLKVKGRPRTDVLHRIKESIETKFPDIKFLVVDESVDLEVIRRERS